MAPYFVPDSVCNAITLAPVKGSPALSTTRPLIDEVVTPCEKAVKLPNSKTSSSSFFIVVCLVKKFLQRYIYLIDFH